MVYDMTSEICAPGAVEDLAQGVRVATSSYGHRSVLGHIEGPVRGETEIRWLCKDVGSWILAERNCTKKTVYSNAELSMASTS